MESKKKNEFVEKDELFESEKQKEAQKAKEYIEALIAKGILVRAEGSARKKKTIKYGVYFYKDDKEKVDYKAETQIKTPELISSDYNLVISINEIYVGHSEMYNNDYMIFHSTVGEEKIPIYYRTSSKYLMNEVFRNLIDKEGFLLRDRCNEVSFQQVNKSWKGREFQVVSIV